MTVKISATRAALGSVPKLARCRRRLLAPYNVYFDVHALPLLTFVHRSPHLHHPAVDIPESYKTTSHRFRYSRATNRRDADPTRPHSPPTIHPLRPHHTTHMRPQGAFNTQSRRSEIIHHPSQSLTSPSPNLPTISRTIITKPVTERNNNLKSSRAATNTRHEGAQLG